MRGRARARAGVEPGIEQVFGANRCSMTEQVFGFPESGESPLPCNTNRCSPP